jgi:hypothetical protein
MDRLVGSIDRTRKGQSRLGLWAATGAGLGVTLRTTVGLPNTLAVLKPGASGLPTLPKVSLTLCKTKADSAVIRLSEILRKPLPSKSLVGRGSRETRCYGQAPRIHLPNSAVMPLSAPSRCLPRGHGSDYANRSSVDQANRVDAKKKFQTPMSFGLLAGSTL